jgi:hypothetical protein
LKEAEDAEAFRSVNRSRCKGDLLAQPGVREIVLSI